jgi:hypothetical protein
VRVLAALRAVAALRDGRPGRAAAEVDKVAHERVGVCVVRRRRVRVRGQQEDGWREGRGRQGGRRGLFDGVSAMGTGTARDGAR